MSKNLFSLRSFFAILPVSIWLLAPAALLATDISFVNIFANISNQQVGNGNDLTSNGTFFSLDLTSTTPNAYSAASVTYPGPDSPQNLAQSSPTDYTFQTGLLPDLAAMQAAYPFGTYTFQGTNGVITDTATLPYNANDFALSTPYLTGSDFSNLQGMNPSQPFTFHFSPFDTGSNATASFIFFTIFDFTTNSFVYNQGFLAPSTTSVTVPGNTLTAGHQYGYEVDFSNRDVAADNGGATFPPQLGFDVRTDGDFTPAAVPEPRSSVALIAIGLFGCFALKRRASGPSRP